VWTNAAAWGSAVECDVVSDVTRSCDHSLVPARYTRFSASVNEIDVYTIHFNMHVLYGPQ
jgi:hypothetical protein